MKQLLLIAMILSTSLLFSKTITKNRCQNLKGNYIWSSGECIQYAFYPGEKKDTLIVTIHGAWKEGADTLSHYKLFAENLNMETDLSTIAIALPGYSGSSANHIQALTHNKNALHTAATKKYIDFLATLLKDLKKKFNAKHLIVVAHSAGALTTAAILGYKPYLIQIALLAGGRYDIHKIDNDKTLLSATDLIDKIPKETKIILVYGTKDTISNPTVTKEFYKLAKSKDLNVTLIEIKDAPHLDLDMQDKSIEALKKMIP